MPDLVFARRALRAFDERCPDPDEAEREARLHLVAAVATALRAADPHDPEALALLEEAVDRLPPPHTRDAAFRAWAAEQLGLLARWLGEDGLHDDAAARARELLGYARARERCGDPDCGVDAVLATFGPLLAAWARPEEALAWLDEATARAAADGRPDPVAASTREGVDTLCRARLLAHLRAVVERATDEMTALATAVAMSADGEDADVDGARVLPQRDPTADLQAVRRLDRAARRLQLDGEDEHAGTAAKVAEGLRWASRVASFRHPLVVREEVEELRGFLSRLDEPLDEETVRELLGHAVGHAETLNEIDEGGLHQFAASELLVALAAVTRDPAARRHALDQAARAAMQVLRHVRDAPHVAAGMMDASRQLVEAAGDDQGVRRQGLTGIVLGSQALMRIPGHAAAWLDGIDALLELVAMADGDAAAREQVLGIVDSWLYEAPELGIAEEAVAPRRACFVAFSGAAVGPSFD